MACFIKYVINLYNLTINIHKLQSLNLNPFYSEKPWTFQFFHAKH